MYNIIKPSVVIVLLFSFAVTAQNNIPVVTNVAFTERTDGSFKVDVTYDVNDADNDPMTVSMLVSTDAGQSWNFSVNNISGDAGGNIMSGTGKHIVWNFGTEHPQFFSDQIIIKIIADDSSGLSCPGTPTVTYAGKTYNTVQIGNQCWLKENLDVGIMIDSLVSQTNNGIIEKYCYRNNASNCTTYGGLYQWDEAMQYTEGTQGICPSGWHIPTVGECLTLQTYVNDEAVKLIDESQPMINGLTATNETGFSALFAGYNYILYDGSGRFNGLGDYAYFWNSIESNIYYANDFRLNHGASFVYFHYALKSFGHSVRCLKD